MRRVVERMAEVGLKPLSLAFSSEDGVCYSRESARYAWKRSGTLIRKFSIHE